MSAPEPPRSLPAPLATLKEQARQAAQEVARARQREADALADASWAALQDAVQSLLPAELLPFTDLTRPEPWSPDTARHWLRFQLPGHAALWVLFTRVVWNPPHWARPNAWSRGASAGPVWYVGSAHHSPDASGEMNRPGAAWPTLGEALLAAERLEADRRAPRRPERGIDLGALAAGELPGDDLSDA
jgi:hypothetical protein